jgi:hypothetical protein
MRTSFVASAELCNGALVYVAVSSEENIMQRLGRRIQTHLLRNVHEKPPPVPGPVLPVGHLADDLLCNPRDGDLTSLIQTT